MTIDPNSATWEIVKAHAETEIAAALARLEMPGRPEFMSNIDRGILKALRNLLDLTRKPVEHKMTTITGY